MQIQRVSLKPIKTTGNGLADCSFLECNSCGKLVTKSEDVRNLCSVLSGEQSFYCSFCLRHGLNTRNRRHVLPISFRSIIGFYYYAFYCNEDNHQKIWLSEIKDYLKIHEEVGLLNPVFNYDPETYLWFVDFSKVGHGNKKLELNDVLNTTTDILACFNLYHYVQGDLNRFYSKYREGIERFYSQRSRPENRPELIPTLVNVKPQVRFDLEITRNFLPQKLISR
jgi:hypothetical protein